VDDERFRDGVAVDLVSYLVVVVPDLPSVSELAPPLLELVERQWLRVLDLVVISSGHDGSRQVLELGSADELSSLAVLEKQVLGLMTDHDIELASFALRPGTVGVVILAEDHWAEPLSTAAQRVGGRIVAGERIPASRIEAALRSVDDREGGG
jgi:hypothetical protein